MSKNESSPNKLHRSEIIKYPKHPHLAALIMQTDWGTINLAINKAVAEILRDELDRFLQKTPPY